MERVVLDAYALIAFLRGEEAGAEAKQHRIQLEIDRFRASDHIDRDRVHERAIR